MRILLKVGSRGQLKCDGTSAETRFRLSAKWTSPFKSVEASVQSTTGSRVVRITFQLASNAGYTMSRGSVKSTGYPLRSPVSPSLPLPCVTVCHHISNWVYYYPFALCYAQKTRQWTPLLPHMMATVINAEWSRNFHCSMRCIPEIRLSVFNCTYTYILAIKVTINESVQVSLHIFAWKKLLTEHFFNGMKQPSIILPEDNAWRTGWLILLHPFTLPCFRECLNEQWGNVILYPH